jgi:hypothetical protein
LFSGVQQNKVKKIILRFEEWLIDQQYREDPIGDLARVPSMQDVEHKASRRKADEHKNWTEIVIKIAEPGYIAVFNDAWQEFLLAKQTAKESLD